MLYETSFYKLLHKIVWKLFESKLVVNEQTNKAITHKKYVFNSF